MAMTESASKYFQHTAGSWDQISAGYFGKEVRQAAIAKAYLRPEMAVADVGAGTGFVSAGLAPLVKRVYVVDGSPAMLAEAKKNLSAFDNVEYHQADGAGLPFPDESLDAVFANMVLHHAVDPLAAIREMVRVLRPGGRLVITDLDAHAHAWLKEEMADEWLGFDRDQMRAWFREVGLVNVIVDHTGQSCCAECGEPTLTGEQEHEANDLREAKVGVFVATGTRRMNMRAAVQDNYAAVAQAGPGCGCSPAAESSEGCCGSGSSSESGTGSSSGSGTGSSRESGSCCGSSSGSGCCGASQSEEITFTTGYTPVELSAAPKEAADISLGCGNPLAMAGLKPGEVVLDIGSGGGLDSFLAAGKVGLGGRVIGVDMTPAMLERARASAERNQITNVEFRQGYAEELPVADGEVDVIISNCVINLTEDKGHVFREAFRALKPGGRLEVSDVVASGPMPLEMQGNAAGWAECVTGALPEQEYLDLIAQAGFEQITTRRSPSMGEASGVSVFSLIASARKPGSFRPRTSVMSNFREKKQDWRCC